MPLISFQHALTGIGTYDLIHVPIDTHYIMGVSLQVLDTNEDPFGCHAIIGIMQGYAARQFIKIPFASGYLGTHAPLGWSGRFPTEPDMGVYAEVMGSTNVKVVLSASLWKMVLKEDGTYGFDP